MRPKTIHRILLLGAALWTMSACGSDPATSDTDTGTETDSSEGSDSGTDTDTEKSAACADFHDYAEGCGLSGQPLVILDMMCSTMDSLFIDSFLEDMMACFQPGSCEEFLALLASGVTGGDPDAGDADAGTSDDPFAQCTASAMLTTEPEPANLAFQENFCAWAMQCNGDISELECALFFADPDGMLLFTVLDDTYITQANDCVDPMPACTEDVTGCLDAVTANIEDVLGILSAF